MKLFTNFSVTLIFFFLLSSLLSAQEALKDKVDLIKGDVDKVTISAGGEQYNFEGDDAKTLFKKMKSALLKSHKFIWHTDDDEIECHDGNIIFLDEDGNKKIIKIKKDGDEDIDIFISNDFDMNEHHGIEKKVKVEIGDGKKKVTVTTKENGEEKTEIYEDEEAEEYLEQMKSEHGSEILIEVDEDGKHKKMKKIIIETETEVENE